MARSSDAINVYLEIGKKRTFAAALDWPGWCRRGQDDTAALQALVDAGPRYARVLHAAQLAFHPPADASTFAVVERLAGNDATDFGAANIAPSSDARPLDAADLRRSQALLQAIWRAFDNAVEAATGKELRKGPRGGGRDLEGIIRHVRDGDGGYLSRLARKVPKDEAADLPEQLSRTRQAMLEALEAGLRGEIPERGPRGGTLWTPRYFVRRVAWHTLDHAWEIEDRIIP
ncbi:MAG: hypothetical protein M3Q65_11395 [Chloroflexota bacterium]|nr:hypothetical protein [Chloroflexota bacterium]